ncbi:MAG: ATP-NAD kinase family protein [Clostridiales Family XIII bacterium]|jgi:predicted polyphosphate/ATP-dependent NAD kinase|nr:ATP-NAD kinase family protein [Clostridiales Family XIII bacterium]
MFKLGLIVNPVAGIGGKVGLKGSDGAETQKKALCMGAKPESGDKTRTAIRQLLEKMGERAGARGSAEASGNAGAEENAIEILTFPGEMGADIVRDFDFPCRVIGTIAPGATTASDTAAAAVALRDAQADLILFAGGDGTARDVLDAVGMTIPVLGIPAGCKIHSGVYAINPKAAGDLAAKYVEGLIRETKESEVMDIDEDLFRENIVNAKLYGYLKVPKETRMMQNMKSGRSNSESGSVEQIARYLTDTMEDDALYIFGGGSTTMKIMETAGLTGTLLGVDLVHGKRMHKADATENDILAALDEHPKAKIIVTVIGGQGYVFGRGNQQISAEVLRRVGKENIIVAASKDKMYSLFGKSLLADTGDEDMNERLCGYYRVVVGYEESTMFRLIA